MLILFCALCGLFFFKSKNLVLSLIILEMIGFTLISSFMVFSFSFFSMDFLFFCLFSIFVMEGVIALAGMIFLVSSSGSDYISSSSLLFC